MRHLLVTNDFPPKLGGIQSYLWELWRRLPPDDVTVLTTPYAGADKWDTDQAFRVVRTKQRVLLPTPALAREIDSLADDAGAALVVLDPALPLGALGPRLRHRYAVVLHGAEIAVPGRMPGASAVLRSVLRGAQLVIAAGGYPLAEAERCARRPLPSVVVPPGVDAERFRPLPDDERRIARRRFGLDPDAPLVLGVSRLVPRKGFDVVLRAAAHLPDAHVAIGGGGRDAKRLGRVAATSGVERRVSFLGRVPDGDLPDLYAAADVFAMLCRNRWAGLEQEGFGIVFLEAAAAGVPQVAGRSGGSHEAIADGETGVVVEAPTDVDAVAAALRALLDDGSRRQAMGAAARRRAVDQFTYYLLAARLAAALDG